VTGHITDLPFPHLPSRLTARVAVVLARPPRTRTATMSSPRSGSRPTSPATAPSPRASRCVPWQLASEYRRAAVSNAGSTRAPSVLGTVW